MGDRNQSHGPSSFKGIIRKYVADLPQRPSDGMKNIDAQEFLAFMINEMHEETIVEPNDPFLEIVQPFLVLHLNISPSSVHTIEDSLRLHFGTKNNEGYRSSEDYADKNSAGKSTKIEKLPRILILHLMRFSFENSGSGFVKFDKPVKFPSDLEIENDLLATPHKDQRIFV
ncbi:ubiquitin carboxyl-terminal hydrolase 24-like [Dioscorea cayenensis subsp. rotundata]|uniref:ubiquitinyl hydrolase 1 n=1 Tax=Dioscorea cayennensis subsp. rotundata TaxID=55577 RepID=A0AB40AUY7_DIOCR|nr:ubiquitin carboxyl-terminal hydrolase 24-like [Dioscorea cayenensis subsp. rotundata]